MIISLFQFVLYYYKESRQTYASMFAKISIDPSQPIRKDMVFNKEYTHLYVMTERQVLDVYVLGQDKNLCCMFLYTSRHSWKSCVLIRL